MRYVKLNIPVDSRVPKDYQLIRAYSDGKEIVVELDVNDLKDDDHNCDWEGCSTVTHVVRFSPEHKYKIERKLSELETRTNITKQPKGDGK